MNDIHIKLVPNGGLKFCIYHLTARIKRGPGKGRNRPQFKFFKPE